MLHGKWVKSHRAKPSEVVIFNATLVVLITAIPMLFPVNIILVHTSQFSVQNSAATGLPVAYAHQKFGFLCLINTHTLTLQSNLLLCI